VSRIGFHELGFNCYNSPKSKGNPLLLDYRIRQAIHWAIDKEKIDRQAMDGKAVVGTSVISPAAGDWHWNPPADQLVTYNPEKAKQILTAAGYIDRNGDGIRESPKGKKLSFRLAAMSAYSDDIAAAKMIHQWLADVGIDTKLEIVDEGAFGDRVLDNADMDMYIWSWGGDIDPAFMLSCFTTTQILNWSDCMYSNPAYDALYKEQASAIDRTKRLQIVHQMQQILYQQDPYIILWYNVDSQAYRTDEWTGWELVPSGSGRPIWTFLRGTYIGVKPATAVATAGGGLHGGAIAGIAVAAVVVCGAIAWLLVRRRRPAQSEEL
jgi:peptide/nickel transport system substrate-binding protein